MNVCVETHRFSLSVYIRSLCGWKSALHCFFTYMGYFLTKVDWNLKNVSLSTSDSFKGMRLNEVTSRNKVTPVCFQVQSSWVLLERGNHPAPSAREVRASEICSRTQNDAQGTRLHRFWRGVLQLPSVCRGLSAVGTRHQQLLQEADACVPAVGAAPATRVSV